MKKLFKGLLLTTMVTGAAVAAAYYVVKGSKKQDEPLYIEQKDEEEPDLFRISDLFGKLERQEVLGDGEIQVVNY